MNEQFFKDIAEKVESGEYFEDAREWYHIKYSFPIIERSYCIMFCLISIAIAFYTVNVINSFFPLNKPVPIAVYVADQTKFYAELKKLSVSRTANPNITLQKYLLIQFIRAYENYIPEKGGKQVQRNLKFIEKFSGPNVVSSFQKLISLNNPDGYLIRYRNGLRRANIDKKSLKISYKKSTRDSISFTDKATSKTKKSDNNYTASVFFTTDEVSGSSMRREVIQKKFKATMKYRFDDVSFDTTIKDFNPLIFKIISHTITEIK